MTPMAETNIVGGHVNIWRFNSCTIFFTYSHTHPWIKRNYLIFECVLPHKFIFENFRPNFLLVTNMVMFKNNGEEKPEKIFKKIQNVGLVINKLLACIFRMQNPIVLW